ncbi:MAG: alanine racemase [Anaerolineae bacterium]|nr:alanine racemase [Anaerolineae bacterium]
MIPNGVVTWAEIDLDAIAQNVEAIKAFVGPDTEIIASVKANAYGHGLLPIARIALEAGASRLAVHRIQAGVALREAGIQAPILLLGHTPPLGVPTVLDYNITPTVVDWETAAMLSAYADEPVYVHVKVDTGMSRFGLEPEKALSLVRYISKLPHLVVEGLFSHFATADEENLGPARRQLKRFLAILAEIENAGYPISVPHICNSAGVVTLPEAYLAAVRPGILIYGMAPSLYSQPPFPLRPALTLKSTVIHTRTLPSGSTISYGRTYTTRVPMQAALVSLGYGDGYPRLISNRGEVLIRGQRAPIRGRICMDQFVVDVSDIPGVRVGDEVVAIGEQDGAVISPEEVAEWADTINYEITTGLLPQVVRVYKQDGHCNSLEEGIEQWASYLMAV